MLGALLALLAAATFGFNDATVRRGVVTGSVVQGLAVTVPIGVPLFFLAAVVSGQLFDVGALTGPSALMLAGAGVAHFVWGRYCNYRAVKAMGGNRAGPVQQTSLLISLVLAVALLDESVGWIRLVGILLIVAGPTIMVERQRASTPKAEATVIPGIAGGANGGESAVAAKPAFTPRLAEGYTFALLSALGYGVSPVLIRAGIEESGLSLLGGLISYGAATVVVLVVILASASLRNSVANMERSNLRWFTISGVAVFLAQMFRYMGLAIAPVSVVASIMRLGLVFRVIFGYFINREYESFAPRVLVGIVVSILGGVALTISL
ncbi:MAG: EamA family transporter [Chloroflexi bacterium]|nr:EamA family transporter [Chloroflexota bacterium]